MKARQWVQKAAVWWGTRHALEPERHPAGDWSALEGKVYPGHIWQAPLQPHEHTLCICHCGPTWHYLSPTLAECDVHGILYKSNQALKPNFQFIGNTGNKGIS